MGAGRGDFVARERHTAERDIRYTVPRRYGAKVREMRAMHASLARLKTGRRARGCPRFAVTLIYFREKKNLFVLVIGKKL